MPNFEVPMTFVFVVEAEDADSAVDAAYKLYNSGAVAEQIKIGTSEPLDISWKDVEEV